MISVYPLSFLSSLRLPVLEAKELDEVIACALRLFSKMLPFGSVLFTFGTLSTASAFGRHLSSQPYAVKERHVVPKQWTRLGRAPADTVLELRIALKQSQFDKLERHLNEGKGLLHFVNGHC